MTNNFIPGGYILLSRKLIESEIWNMSPLHLKVWLYILMKARHEADEAKGFERGECLISIPELQEVCSYKVGYRTEKPTKHQIDNILRWLRKTSEATNEYDMKTSMITTTKTTRGMVVKVHNYNVYQNPKNYEYDKENDNENETSTKRLRQQSDTIHKNVKELKNDKKVVVSDSDNTFKTILNLYQENIEMTPSQITLQKIGQDFDDYGHELMKHAIEKSALANNHDYRFIAYLLKDWNKNQLRTVEAVKQYEAQREAKKNYSNNRGQTATVSPYANMEFIEPDENDLPF